MVEWNIKMGGEGAGKAHCVNTAGQKRVNRRTASNSQHMYLQCNFLYLSWKRPKSQRISYKGHILCDQILPPDPLQYQMTVIVSVQKSWPAPGKSLAPSAHLSFAGLIH